MLNKRFEEPLHYVDKRFEAIDKKFEELLHYVDKRFEDMNKKINILIWVVSLWLTVFSAISLILRIFG